MTFVITDLDTGGAERALVNLATRLDRQIWQPSVVCLDKPGELNVPLQNAGIEVVNLNVDRRKPVQAVFKLARALRGLRPQVIQTFLFHANIAARLAAPFAGRPPVVCGIRVAEREKKWHLTLDRLTHKLTVASICVSEGVRKFTINEGKIPAHKLMIIPNGIDASVYDASSPASLQELGLKATDCIALFIGRLVKQKDVPTLLQAVARLVPDHPDLQLLIVGDGPDRDMLISQSKEFKNHVHWLGRCNDIPSLLLAADFLVLPSLWEGMPNVVLEAMAAGRAVIATEVEGSDELIVNGETGWLVPPRDVESFAGAIYDLVMDRENSRRFGAAGRTRVERDYSMQRVVSAYEQVWKKILE